MKDRIEVCKYYISANVCEKSRKAEHFGYCQKCNKYEPRIRRRHLNQKKIKLQKIREADQ